MGKITAGINQPTVIDLFSGAGGFSLGFEKARFRVLCAVDFHNDPMKTYLYNRLEIKKQFIPIVKDIRKIKGNDILRAISKVHGKSIEVDVVIGGPPCQGFSIRGKKNKKDPRNNLVNDFFRLIGEIKPKIFVFENVTGLLNERNYEFLKYIIKKIGSLGYHFSLDVLNASDYGVPQNRKRLIIIGSRISNKIIFPTTKKKNFNRDIFRKLKVIPPKYNAVPIIKKKIKISDAIDDLAYNKVTQNPIKYLKKTNSIYQVLLKGDEERLYNHITTKHRKSSIEVFKMLKPGQELNSLPKNLRPNRRSCKKMDASELSRTITSCNEDFIHYSINRIITIREMARIQSYPDNYIFMGVRTTGSYRRKQSCCQVQQVGNSVPPLLAQAIAEGILEMLGIPSNNEFKRFIEKVNLGIK